MSAPTPVCRARWLGRMDYEQAWARQRELALRRARGEIDDTLLLLEHPPVYTSGRRNFTERLLVSREALGAPLLVVDRGGDITFHGPGQLIAYPITGLGAHPRGVQAYVRGLEETIIRTLAGYGIEASREEGLTGVWVDGEKIAAIGVRVSRPGGAAGGWVTSHGLALNVSVDLAWFERIIPCGIAGRGVTSMKRLLGRTVPLEQVARRLAGEFGAVFGRELVSAADDAAQAAALLVAPAGDTIGRE
ncbi:MAG TPA: lipoyl(octanoyl) transferase LipB [Methylomirabilota bacterium]|nr:lipoyl(octanoyl) transferase LipB [Methylomirabilota bacterium]